MSRELTLTGSLNAQANGAAVFESASSQRLTVAGNSNLWGSSGAWWRAGWFKTNTVSGSAQLLSTNLSGTSGWGLLRSGSQLFVRAQLGLGSTSVPAQSSAGVNITLSTGTWYFFYLQMNSAQTHIGISLNDGYFNNGAGVGAFVPGSGSFNLGSTATPDTYFDGQLDQLLLGTGNLSASQITALYNSASGIGPASKLTAAQIAAYGIFSGYDFDVSSNLGLDSIGTNHLTNTNAVTYAVRLANAYTQSLSLTGQI